MSIVIRRANENDLDWLLSELKAFADFFGTGKILFPSKLTDAEALLKTWIAGQLMFMAERDGERLGFIAGMIHQHVFNPEIRCLTEMFWWVPEKHRGTRAGLMLINEFAKWGKDNVDWVLFTLEDNSPVNEKSLTKRGFKLKEKQYLLEVS